MLSYLHAFWIALVILLLIAIPGIALARYRQIGPAYMPIPGIILLSLFGLMGWVLNETYIAPLRGIMASAYSSLLLIALINMRLWNFDYLPSRIPT
jgi:hypothetical protein